MKISLILSSKLLKDKEFNVIYGSTLLCKYHNKNFLTAESVLFLTLN